MAVTTSFIFPLASLYKIRMTVIPIEIPLFTNSKRVEVTENSGHAPFHLFATEV